MQPVSIKIALLIGFCSSVPGLIPTYGFIVSMVVFVVMLFYIAGIEANKIGFFYLVNIALSYLWMILKAAAVQKGWLNF